MQTAISAYLSYDINDKFEIKVKYASAKAIEKVEKAGGKVEGRCLRARGLYQPGIF